MGNKKIALVGNPNSGKTTLFNVLTGSSQHVGNWPGVTVEKKEGVLKANGTEYQVIDLPGIYSLGAFSEDEIVAMEYILSGDADVVINVIDASNIERNLYLTSQLLEMGQNIVVALNMADEAEKRNIKFDLAGLSDQLGVPVISTVAHRAEGKEAVIKAVLDAVEKKKTYANPLEYNSNVVHHIEHIEEILAGKKLPYPAPWTAIKIVEGDSHVLQKLRQADVDAALLDEIDEFYKFHSSDSFELEIVDSRYAFANNVAARNVIRPETEVVTLSDKIDKYLINKYLGIPIFAVIMFIVFQITFVVGEDLLGGYAVTLIDWLGGLFEGLLLAVKAPDWLVSFFISGVFNGVGAVIEFVPLSRSFTCCWAFWRTVAIWPGPPMSGTA